jgi:hypothetical protein
VAFAQLGEKKQGLKCRPIVTSARDLQFEQRASLAVARVLGQFTSELQSVAATIVDIGSRRTAREKATEKNQDEYDASPGMVDRPNARSPLYHERWM